MTTQPTVAIPQGVVDVQADVAYVLGEEGRIFCLDLGSGEVLARTDFAATPVTVDRGVLISWTCVPDRPNEIRLFATVREGNLLRPQWEEALPLPDWVDASSPEPNGFSLEAEIRGGRVTVTWEAHSRYRGGAPPPSRVEEAATHDERHTIQLDRETGATVGEERSEPAARPEQVLPKLTPNMQIVPYRSGTSWMTRPWRAGAANAFLVRTAHEPGIVLVLKGDLGAAAEIRLTGDPDAEAAVTPDGRLIFLHESGGIEPAWQVFSAETGEPVASLGFDPGTKGVSVVRDRVLYLVQEDTGRTRRRMLRCRNLHTGKAMWSYALCEEALRAPPPPLR